MISPTQYKFVSDQINKLQSIEETSIDFLDSFEIEINYLANLKENVDDVKERRSNIETMMNTRLNLGKTVGLFVENLQLHVLNNTSYTDINDYLQDFGMKVKQLFADVSERMGYPILHFNIE